MLKLSPYKPVDKPLWDAFVKNARNGLFWLQRDYLGYNEDRITDHSILFLKDERKVVGALPANREDRTLNSYGGLPFGGLILARGAGLHDISQMLDLLAAHMRTEGLERLVFTPMPSPYQKTEGDEVEVLLQERGAHLRQTRLTSMLRLKADGLPELLSSRRLKQIRKARRCYPLELGITEDAEEIWPALERFLRDRFGRSPIHSLEEIRKLKKAFPENIYFLTAKEESRLVGGLIVFVFEKVLRLQACFRVGENQSDYLSTRLDLFAMKTFADSCGVCDVGTSYDPVTGNLQAELFRYKEYLGARGIALCSWEWIP
ncbi:MAG: hypothetical protein LAT55_05990 [Opitutales bacterium]|nr:hypothetical protein [Opitutales bacterium]